MLSLNVPLILLVMHHSTERYWDDEGFREIVEGPTFEEVQERFRKLDNAPTPLGLRVIHEIPFQKEIHDT